MKKTIIALFALAGAAVATESPLTLADHWTFDQNLTSVNGKTFIGQGTSVTYSNGSADVRLAWNGASGLHLNEANTLGLTGGNWAMQLDFSLEQTNTGNVAQVFACLNNVEHGGTELCIANANDGKVYGVAVTPNFESWSADSRTDAVANIGGRTVLTLLNYDNALYVCQNGKWATFGASSASTTLGDNTLGKLTLGFGQGGTRGLNAQHLILNDLAVYTFDSQTVSLAEVKALIPEPATATLSLLALVGLAARRRRH